MADRSVSIIILAHNQLELTRACVESIKEHTENFELIMVDNGSSDGTRGYFEKLKKHGARTVYNGNNLGYPMGVNQGLKVAGGEYIVLLNNDTLVTEGWLGKLVAVIEENPTIGIVGAITNRVRQGPQLYGDHYLTRKGMQLWGRFVGRIAAGQFAMVDSVVGMCMLISRRCFQTVGYFDERFGIGNFEDDDYCRRARANGFGVAVAEDCWIHHEGSATFKATGVDYKALLTKNRKLFEEKWRDSESAAQPRQGLIVVARR